MVDFYDVFYNYLKIIFLCDLIQPMKLQLHNSKPPLNSKIAFMHIDSPKFYDELKFIFQIFSIYEN